MTPSPRSNLRQRIITGCIAAAVALPLTLAHPASFTALLAAACFIGMREWEGLNLYRTWGFRLAGALYLLGACAALAWLRMQPYGNGDTLIYGAHWILGLFALVWTTDIAAYASGRLIGGPKIAPAISPNKTWAGSIGAIVATALVAALLARWLPQLPLAAALCGGVILSIVAQAGDFFESWLKRRAGIKDSGTLLPGHGGILDRVDGLLPASIAYALFLYIYVGP